MPQFLAAAGLWLGRIGAASLAGFGITSAATWVTIAIGAATVGYVGYSALRAAKMRDSGGVGSPDQQLLVRSTVAPRRIVYGEAVVSGPLAFMQTAGAENNNLYSVIALVGHQIDSFQGFYIDDKFVPIADVGGADGAVDDDTTSHGFGPKLGTTVLYIRTYLGTAAQTVDTVLDAAFTEWTSDHRGRGVSYVVVQMVRLQGDEDTWEAGAPQNISALIRGKLVYDPRLDSTFSGTWGTGSGAHRVATPSTWAYSANPALCTADYHIDADLGAGINSARIDYNAIAFAADACDVNVAIPTATTQDRFTCNGVLSCDTDYRENIKKLLSGMAGQRRRYNGKIVIDAGVWPSASSFALNETHLIGPLTYRQAPERMERYNAIRGTYFDPSRNYKESPYLSVEDATLQTDRDDGMTLWKDLDLPMTNNEYMAQRLAFRAVEQASRTGILIFPTGYNGLDIAPGDRGSVTIAELGWSAKTVRCVGLRHVDMVGVELVLKEDDSAAYADPAEGDYGTRTAAGVIDFPGVPMPTVGVIVDPLFVMPIGQSWLVEAGSGVSVVSGGGEGGGNALELTNAASVTQAARNSRKFRTSPGEIISGETRVKKTADVSSIAVRFTYFRSDTGASLGTVDQTLVLAAAATYYTISFRQRTPTTYTLAAGIQMLGQIQVRMVPDGSGTATATFTSISATRSGTVGQPEIDRDSATEVYTIETFGSELWSAGNNWEDSVSITLDEDAYILITARCNSISGTGALWTPFVGGTDGEGSENDTPYLLVSWPFSVAAGTYDVGMRGTTSSGGGSVNDRFIEIVVVKR